MARPRLNLEPELRGNLSNFFLAFVLRVLRFGLKCLHSEKYSKQWKGSNNIPGLNRSLRLVQLPSLDVSQSIRVLYPTRNYWQVLGHCFGRVHNFDMNPIPAHNLWFRQTVGRIKGQKKNSNNDHITRRISESSDKGLDLFMDKNIKTDSPSHVGHHITRLW